VLENVKKTCKDVKNNLIDDKNKKKNVGKMVGNVKKMMGDVKRTLDNIGQMLKDNMKNYNKNIKIITTIKGVWRDVRDILHGNPNCNVVSQTFITSN
jgi:hypothetical protein